MSKTKAVVVLSGGQDSTTCLFWAKQRFDELYAITFNYGQRHILETHAARKVADLANVEEHRMLDIHPGMLLSASPLTSDNELEEYEDFESMSEIIGDRRELTFVPMRNDLFLTIAANYAEAIGAKNIVTGVCEDDGANYSDCRQTFIDAKEKSINEALGYDSPEDKVSIHTPLMKLSKAQSIKLAQDTPGAFEALAYTHTCYAGKFPPCGKCHACVLRAEGFRQAGVDDPLMVRAAGV